MIENSDAVQEQPIEVLDESKILDELRRQGERIAILNAQIDPLEAALAVELREVKRYYALYQNYEPIALLAESLIEANPQTGKKKDKRSKYNPIKNLNIGVRRSYEWKEKKDLPPKTAKKMVYASILKTAIKKGVHATSCACGGKTVDCTVPKLQIIYVAVKHDLPAEVIAKIDQAHKTYEAQYEARHKHEETLPIEVVEVETIPTLTAIGSS